MTGCSVPIDYERLESELQEAIRADELYRLQNDAKLRAVEQNVPTYERFRQMVNGAHLRPLEPNDVKSRPDILWNPIALSNSQQRSRRNDRSKKKGDSSKAFTDFHRTFHRIEEDKRKFDYLHNSRHLLRTDLCRVDVPPSLLTEILRLCLIIVTETEEDLINPVVEVLETVSLCPRFALTVSFMSKEEREICDRLFRSLRLKTEDRLANEIQSLARAYQAKLH